MKIILVDTMIKPLKRHLATLLTNTIITVTSFSASAQQIIIPSPPSINAQGHILIDYTTGKVISEQNADALLEPASLTKIMTSYVIGHEINTGNIALTDKVTVSETAWAKNFPDSSRMFIEVGKQISVADLNRGIIVQSGNDACVAMAEHVAGSEEAFADLMNAHAKRLGMLDSHFENSHGLHSSSHHTTPRDMATLSIALIRDMPDEYKIYSEKFFEYNGIKQYNRNRLLWDKSLLVDGIKTGYHSGAGYSLVTSAVKADMRLISVVMGTESKRAREIENKKLLNYGFRFYETITPFKPGKVFTSQRVWSGEQPEVKLGILTSSPITIPRGHRKKLTTKFELDGELEAPIKKGTVVGQLQIILGEEQITSYPLVALEKVAEGSLVTRLIDYIKRQFN